MRAISLHQPWATLISAGYKRIETRDWRPDSLRPGQLVAIHAAKHWPPDYWDEMRDEPFFKRYLELARRRHLWSFKTPPLGGVVAIARFQGAYPTERLRPYLSQREQAFGNYAPSRYGWLFSEVRPVAIIPARGQQGLFDWDAPREIANLYQEPINQMEQALFSRLTGTLLAVDAGPSSATPPAPQPATAAPTGPTTVVHVNRDPFDKYVGRQVRKRPDLQPIGFGNPYHVGIDTPGGRQSAIDRYRNWILDQPKLLARLPELRGRALGCWCAPAGGLPGDLYGHVCHGEVLAALADRWCAQCQQIESPEHVREHEAAAETGVRQIVGALTRDGQFSEVTS